MDKMKLNELNRLERRLKSHQIDRRSFMMGALALGLTVPAASALVSKAEAATPKKGGVWRQGLTGAGTGDSLDPAPGASSLSSDICSMPLSPFSSVWLPSAPAVAPP